MRCTRMHYDGLTRPTSWYNTEHNPEYDTFSIYYLLYLSPILLLFPAIRILIHKEIRFEKALRILIVSLTVRKIASGWLFMTPKWLW